MPTPHIKEQENCSITMKPLDPQEFRRRGYMVIDFIAGYLENIEKHPVVSQLQPGDLIKQLPNAAPHGPESFEAILEDVQNHIVPGLTHWQSPSHFAYFPNTASTAGILGETLAAGFNVVGFSWITSPAATELEMVVTNWLGDMLQLPKSLMFSGGTGGSVLLGTTCEAILCTLVAARDRALDRIGKENINKLVVYGSDQTHSSFQKSARVAGINPERIRAIKTRKSDLYGLRSKSFKMAVDSDIKAGLVPLYLCATIGTTSINAVDPLEPLCQIAHEYDIWVHVDAAYAGCAIICPEFRHYICGVEGVSSFSLNAHKWLFSNMDCCCLWVNDPSAVTKALGSNPEYLSNTASDSKQVIDYKDWQLSLSRRFRALKLWLVLRSYGVDNLRSFIRSHVDMAVQLEGLVTLNKRFELVMPRYFSLVCFRMILAPAKLAGHRFQQEKGSNCYLKVGSHNDMGGTNAEELALVNKLNRKLLESVNATGKVYVTHGVVEEVFFIRFAIGATLTEPQHVLNSWKLIQDHADSILAEHSQD